MRQNRDIHSRAEPFIRPKAMPGPRFCGKSSSTPGSSPARSKPTGTRSFAATAVRDSDLRTARKVPRPQHFLGAEINIINRTLPPPPRGPSRKFAGARPQNPAQPPRLGLGERGDSAATRSPVATRRASAARSHSQETRKLGVSSACREYP